MVESSIGTVSAVRNAFRTKLEVVIVGLIGVVVRIKIVEKQGLAVIVNSHERQIENPPFLHQTYGELDLFFGGTRPLFPGFSSGIRGVLVQ